MTLKIFNDIPLPEMTPQERKTVYPFQTLQVGQSFFVPRTTKRRFGQTVRNNTERLGKSFYCADYTIKDEDGEDETSGVMVWRIAAPLVR